MTTNPFQKLLPPHKKHDDEEEAVSSGEKQALLGRVLPTPKSRQAGAMTPSHETPLGPRDSVRVWDVKMPPIKADMVQEKLVPTVGRFLGPQLRQKTSRVTIEIHSDTPQQGVKQKGGTTCGSTEDGTTGVMEGLLRGKSMKHDKNEMLHDEQYVIMRIFRRARSKRGLFGGKQDDDDDKDDEGILCT
jgi:hypothetical protein